MAWLAGLAATEGRRAGLAAVAGVALGLLCNGVLAALGLAAVLQTAPQLWNGLRFAGAGMMVWLAIEAWRGAGENAQRPRRTDTVRHSFLTGAMINLLNPKAYIFFLVVAPEFMRGATFGIRAALVFSLISAAIATTIHFAIVLAGSRASAWISDPARNKLVRRAFAIVMLGVAISFILADIR
jgi:threonine/homoserine/homoserine lactone efflux protein